MIERLVLDASVALAWVVNPTEQQARGAQAISELIERDAPICAIPHLWRQVLDLADRFHLAA